MATNQVQLGLLWDLDSVRVETGEFDCSQWMVGQAPERCYPSVQENRELARFVKFFCAGIHLNQRNFRIR